MLLFELCNILEAHDTAAICFPRSVARLRVRGIIVDSMKLTA
jgi:hypothetical protein